MKYCINVHPGKVLQAEIETRSISQSALARHIGVNQSKINDICRERTGISADMAVKLSLALGTTAEFWLNFQNSYDLSKVDRSRFKIKRISA